jgi:hypothetical protein
MCAVTHQLLGAGAGALLGLYFVKSPITVQVIIAVFLGVYGGSFFVQQAYTAWYTEPRPLQ